MFDHNTLRSIREAADLSIAQFAVMLNVTEQELEEMETGRREIPARFDPEAYRVAEDAIPWDKFI